MLLRLTPDASFVLKERWLSNGRRGVTLQWPIDQNASASLRFNTGRQSDVTRASEALQYSSSAQLEPESIPQSPPHPSARSHSGGDQCRYFEQLNTQLQNLVDREDFTQASRLAQAALAEDFKSFDRRAINAVVEGLCRSQQFRRAWRLYSQLLATDALRRQTCFLLVASALQVGQPQEALQVFRYMQSQHMLLTVSHWCQLIDGMSQQRQKGTRAYELPYTLWVELQQTGLVLDAWSFTTGMNACVEAGRVAEAQEVLNAMRRAQYEPTVRCYNILLKGHAQLRNTDHMCQVMADIRAAGLNPNRVTFNTLLNGFIQTEQLDQARETMKQAQMEVGALDVRTYTSLIKSCVRRGRMQAALSVIKEMDTVGAAPNAVTYSTLMEGYARQGNVRMCHELIRQMTLKSVGPNAIVYNILLRVSLQKPRPNIEAAGPVLAAMAEQGIAPGVDTINTIMQAALQAGLPAAVPGLFRQLLKGGLSPSAVSYTALVTALTRLDRPADAVRAFNSLQAEPELGLEGPAITAGVAALAHAGKLAQAQALLERQPAGSAPMLQGWGALVQGQVQRRSAKHAVAALQRFCELGGSPDNRMVDMVVGLCLGQRDRYHAVQVASILDRAGAPVDKVRLQRALAELQAERKAPTQSNASRDQASNEYIERFKFWVGLPNQYYHLED